MTDTEIINQIESWVVRGNTVEISCHHMIGDLIQFDVDSDYYYSYGDSLRSALVKIIASIQNNAVLE